jgi:hypothetical protein
MLGPDEETAAGMLFNLVEDQIQAESESVEQTLKNNVRALALRGTRLKLVDHTEAVLGDTYGVADDHHVRKAMRALQKDGMPMDTTPRQVRDWRIG